MFKDFILFIISGTLYWVCIMFTARFAAHQIKWVRALLSNQVVYCGLMVIAAVLAVYCGLDFVNRLGPMIG